MRQMIIHFIIIIFYHNFFLNVVTYSLSSESELRHDSDDSAIIYIQGVEIDPDQQRTQSNTTPSDENNKLA